MVTPLSASSRTTEIRTDSLWFEHTPLDKSQPHIRLIKIRHCKDDKQPIRCELSIFAVQHLGQWIEESPCPPYRALSYVWDRLMTKSRSS
jgi:hypothetical protein